MVDNVKETTGELRHPRESVEMPRPTAAPIVLALGIALLAAGFALSLVFVAVGALVLFYGLGIWIREWLPGCGHFQEGKLSRTA